MELVQALVQQWPDGLKLADNDGATPLHIAASRGNMELAQLLLPSRSRIPFAKVRPPTCSAVARQGHEAVEISLSPPPTQRPANITH